MNPLSFILSFIQGKRKIQVGVQVKGNMLLVFMKFRILGKIEMLLPMIT